MASSTALLVVTVILSGYINLSTSNSTPEIDLKNYIHWMKEDLTARHNFFPVRALKEEVLTNQAALEAVDSLSNNMNSSLSSVLAFHTKAFQTAQLVMNETEAGGCVQGLSKFIDDAIKEAGESYTDCADDAKSKLSRLSKSLSKVNSEYWATYNRSLNGIQKCAETYRNKDSYHRLKSCVEDMEKAYYKKEQEAMNSLFPSPSMEYFQSTVVDCATRAAEKVDQKGSEFLELLLKCSDVNIDDDPMDYERHLNGWTKYNANLREQILKAKETHMEQRCIAEDAMTVYFDVKKNALDEYVVEERGLSLYKEREYEILNGYYNTVMSTSLDNPDDSNCTSVATSALDRAVSASANQSVKCYTEIVKNATTILENVHKSFTYINDKLPSVGNVALLKCFSQGYFFAPETIRDCYKIASTTFSIDYNDHIADVNGQLSILKEYQNYFQAGSYMPCGGTSLERLYLEGERTLYDLQRCLYIRSGTSYSVTTPTSVVFETKTNVEVTTSEAVGFYEDQTESYAGYSTTSWEDNE